MKTRLISLIVLLSCIFSTSANAGVPDSGIFQKSAAGYVGLYVPFGSEGEADAVIGATYSTYMNSGLGYRLGVQYVCSLYDVNGMVGAPVAVAYRTRMRDTDERLRSSAYGAASSLKRNAYYGSSSGYGQGMILSALTNLFSGAEYYAGITPGIITEKTTGVHHNYSGTYKHTEVAFPVYLTLDAGMNLNYAIWRFDLKLMPAFHYNLTNNYKLVTEKVIENWSDTKKQNLNRFYFSFGLGLSYRF